MKIFYLKKLAKVIFYKIILWEIQKFDKIMTFVINDRNFLKLFLCLYCLHVTELSKCQNVNLFYFTGYFIKIDNIFFYCVYHKHTFSDKII